MPTAFIDRAFSVIKWPIALIALAALPGAVMAAWNLATNVATNFPPTIPFFFGFGVYTALWWMWVRRWRLSFFSTLEHELTHALFAILTFHRVTRIHATATRGGHMRFKGQGNWLITISPYFVPTVCLMLVALFMLLPTGADRWFAPMLGLTLGYHVWSTTHETHGGQSDLKRVGFLFAIAFLPTANILTNGVVIAYAHNNIQGIKDFLSDTYHLTLRIYNLN